MPDSDLAQWLQSRGFYTLTILALLMVGLLLALARRRRRKGRERLSPPHKAALPVKRRRGRPR